MNGYVYLIFDSQFYKIGHTNKPIEQRLKEIQIGNPNELSLIKFYQTYEYKKLEYMLHKRFSNRHIRGEWFNLTEQDISEFNLICETQLKNIEALKSNTFIYSHLLP